jgi:hypothetical protein
MILGDPLLDDLNEFFGLCQNLLCFSLGGNKRVIVINQVSLSPTSVEVITVGVRTFANRELNRVERNPVVSRANDTIASTRDRHFAAWSAAL